MMLFRSRLMASLNQLQAFVPKQLKWPVLISAAPLHPALLLPKRCPWDALLLESRVIHSHQHRQCQSQYLVSRKDHRISLRQINGFHDLAAHHSRLAASKLQNENRFDFKIQSKVWYIFSYSRTVSFVQSTSTDATRLIPSDLEKLEWPSGRFLNRTCQMFSRRWLAWQLQKLRLIRLSISSSLQIFNWRIQSRKLLHQL